MLPLAYPNPLRCASPAARYSHSYCLSAFESAFEKASFKRGFLVSRAITKLRFLAYQHCSETGAWLGISFKYLILID